MQTSTSGYLGGLALRLALGEQAGRIADPLGLCRLSEQQVVLVDARDLDPAEVAYLSTSEVKRLSVEEVRSQVLPEGPLILHIDVDVIDPHELPGLRFPAAGGPSKHAVLQAARQVLATGRVVAVNVACPWNRALQAEDVATRTELLAELTALR